MKDIITKSMKIAVLVGEGEDTYDVSQYGDTKFVDIIYERPTVLKINVIYIGEDTDSVKRLMEDHAQYYIDHNDQMKRLGKIFTDGLFVFPPSI